MDTRTRMTRSRLYILVDSFENDMRRSLTQYVFDHLEEEDALGAIFERVNDRRDVADAEAGSSLVEFLHLQEAYDLLNQHREALPAELGRELKQNSVQAVDLIPIRNRVMHGRPLSPGDPERAIAICQMFTTRYWRSTRETMDHLLADPAWEPTLSLREKASERILHNLPLPEYDDTGLIGRSQDCQRIQKLLLKRREPIITIVGEGGIGKTAVALQVAYSILDHPDSPYECVLWASLKTERLTADGVINIVGAARDITGAAQDLGGAFDESFSGGVDELSHALEDIDTLLVIDNLETVSGVEVTALYDALPDSVTFLFTSRIGIGQFERRIPLEPLKEKDAEFLFRNFAKSRSLERFATFKSDTIAQVTSRLRYSPLAIRWYLLSVEAGREPVETLRDQDELLAFCVQSVYQSFAGDAQTILSMLFALDRSATYDELVIFSEVSADRVRRAIQTLLSGSMVALESDTDNPLISRVRLTEAARHFLRRISPPKAEALESIAKKESDFRKAEEQRRTEERNRQFSSNVVRVRSDHDAPTAHLLRLALVSSRRNDYDQALDYIGRARNLNPEFWEVDKVEAFVLSRRGQIEQATSLYRAALRKSDDEEARAVVSYFFAGHLARKAHDLPQSLEYAEDAHRFFAAPDTAVQLGSFLVWSHRFADGQEYLEAALESATGRTRLITLTALIESWRRWADHLIGNERQFVDAAQKSYAGFALGSREIRSGVVDPRLAAAVLESCAMFIRAVTTTGVPLRDFDRQLNEMLRLVTGYQVIFRETRPWKYFPGYIGKLHRNQAASQELRKLCGPLLPHSEEPPSVESPEGHIMPGRVVGWRGTYGFIEHPNYPDGVFFPASVVENLTERGDVVDISGRLVNFQAQPEPDKRPRATWVSLTQGDEIHFEKGH